MIINFEHNKIKYKADFNKGFDISLTIGGKDNVQCYYAGEAKLEPVSTDQFIGSMKEGFSVNYFKAEIIPHGQGTHTECVGHIDANMMCVSEVLKNHHFVAQLVTINPTQLENGDRVILKEQIESAFLMEELDAVILRTSPNFSVKKNINYSGTNPCYLDVEAMEFLVSKNIKHLLVDLPSVDRESDGGKLAGHKAFWNGARATYATITELIYVPNELEDGVYLLNLQLSTIELDAAPSRPILYKLEKQ